MSQEIIRDIAYGCIALWNQGKFREAYEHYYARDAVKCEPTTIGDFPNEIEGLENLANQEEFIQGALTTPYSVSVAEGPFIGATGFSVIIKSDFAINATGDRHIFREVGIYTVLDGKIVREEFLYDEAELAMAHKLAKLQTGQSTQTN